MDQDHRSAALGNARFDATRWSVVLEAAQSRAAGGPEALARLCERYWPPLYAFVRHRGFSPEDAQDLVQGFFEHLIQSRALGAVDQAKGRFRSFLLASFTQILREEVAQTVLNFEDVDAEVHALCEALVRAEGRVRV